MIDHKIDQEKRNLVILDFDGTIFQNSEKDFSSNIPINRVIDAYTFFNEFTYQTSVKILPDSEYILISGRNESQEGIIAYLLGLKGYQIDQSYFNQAEIPKVINEETFMIKYWNGKLKLINEIRSSNRYKSIVVIDDDSVLCSALDKLGFSVFQAQLTKDSSNQNLTVNFSTPQARSMTELNALLNSRKNQNKSIMETT